MRWQFQEAGMLLVGSCRILHCRLSDRSYVLYNWQPHDSLLQLHSYILRGHMFSGRSVRQYWHRGRLGNLYKQLRNYEIWLYELQTTFTFHKEIYVLMSTCFQDILSLRYSRFYCRRAIPCAPSLCGDTCRRRGAMRPPSLTECYWPPTTRRHSPVPRHAWSLLAAPPRSSHRDLQKIKIKKKEERKENQVIILP